MVLPTTFVINYDNIIGDNEGDDGLEVFYEGGAGEGGRAQEAREGARDRGRQLHDVVV